MNYITFKKMFDYVEKIEKARPVKYIKRFPKKNGKGYDYIYKETFKKPFKALLDIFKVTKERISEVFEKQNIQKNYGVDKTLFGSHVLEYFVNKEKWDAIFTKKANREKYKTPVKQENLKTKEKKETSQKEKKETANKVNRSLMRTIWSAFNPKAKELEKQDNSVVKENLTTESNVNDEDKQQLEDFKFIAWKNRAGSYEYTDKNGNVIKGETGLSGGTIKGKYSDEVAELAKMSKEELEAEEKRLKAIVDEHYQISTRVAASRVGSHIKAMTEAETRLNKVKQVLRRFKKGTQDKQATVKENIPNDELFARFQFATINGILGKNHVQEIEGSKLGTVTVEAGKTGKNGYGLKHIIEQRYKKDGKNEEELAALIPLILQAVKLGEIRNDNGNRAELVKDGVMAVVSKVKNGDEENWLLTGYDLFDEKEKVTDTINEVISEYGYTPEFSGLKKQVGAVIASLGKDNTNTEEMSSGEHGNKTAMLGNQNAFKGHLANKEKVKFVNTVKGEPYEEWNTDVNKFAVYYNRETGKETGLVMTQDIADIIDSCDEPSVLDWKERIANDIHAKYPKIDKRYIEEAITAIRMGYRNGKKQNIKIIEEQSVNVKPQSDSEMKKEQEKTKKARKEAGLPDINENKLNARVSAIEDLSWNPNDENYRYKDTGYIAGARKEMALFVLKNAGKNKVRLRETDIDWEGVEENHRAAKEVIVKSNIFGQVDWATLKENGMTGGAAFLIDRIYSCIGKEPTKDTPEARKNYVIAVNGLRDRLETAKTVQDVENALNEIKDEMNGQFFSVKDTPEYKEKLAEISEIRSKVKGIKDEANRLYDVYNRQDKRENEIIGESKLKWLREHKIIRHNQKYLYGVENKMTPELKAEYDNYCEKLNLENKKESRRLLEEWRQFRNENGAVTDKKYTFDDGAYIYINYEIERELLDKEKELKVYAAKEGAKVLLQNPLFKAWIELGDKFDVIVRSSWKNKTFYNHKADARRGIYDDWEWANKEKIEVSRKGKERKAQFEFKVASKYERKGGRNVSVESTEQLKKAFNLRDIQSGNWVLKDPESAKWHVDRIAEGFADLADVTGIPDNLISLNGRLAMAIGARGVGGAGAAKAHYEPTERVINITKMKGGGSLGHEWFHALDNMIMEAMGGNEGTSAYMMTNKYAHLKPKDKELLNNYLNETYPFMKQRLKMELDKKGIEIPQNPKEIFQIKVANAFDNLTKVMTEGNTVIKEKIIYTHADYKQAVFNIKANAATTTGRKLFEAGNIDNAMNILNGIYKDRKSKTSTKWYKLAAAFYCGNANVEKELVRIDMGKRGSSFLEEALVLDNGTNEYWSSTHEMAARAFSAYIDDRLRSQDRYNDYLANYTENKYYRDPILGDVFPYPEGEERKKINQAFDELFEVIRSENAIRKAMLFEESAHPRGNGGRFTSKFSPDKGGVCGGGENNFSVKENGTSEWGTVYKMENGNPVKAAMFLMSKQDGLVENAFVGRNKQGKSFKVGLCWGHNGMGLKKIIEKHVIQYNDFNSLQEVMDTIQIVLVYGDEKFKNRNKIQIDNGKYRLILDKSENGNIVLTVFNNALMDYEKLRSPEEQEKKRKELVCVDHNSSMQNGTPLFATASKSNTISKSVNKSSLYHHDYERRKNTIVSSDIIHLFDFYDGFACIS